MSETATLTKEQIQYYLQNPSLSKELKKRLKSLRAQVRSFDEEISDIEKDIIEAAQMSVTYKETPSSKTNNMTDLFSVVESTERKIREWRGDVLTQYRQTLEEIETIHRVNLVCNLLNPKDKEIINRLYVQNEKWQVVEYEMTINHRILVQRVNQILTDIQKVCNSTLSNGQIARTKTIVSLKLNGQKKVEKDMQLTVENFFE